MGLACLKNGAVAAPAAATEEADAFAQSLPPVVWLRSAESQQLITSMGPRGKSLLELWKASWEPQENGAYCAPASAVATLRLLQLRSASAWNQTRIFHEVLQPNGLFTAGVSLEHGVRMMQVLGAGELVVEERCILDPVEAEARLRDDLRAAFGDEQAPTTCILANYRRWVPSRGGGHWSPLGGWSEEGSMVLILDTNSTRCPPHWVPLSDMVMAICEWNRTTARPRGYAVVRKNLSNNGATTLEG